MHASTVGMVVLVLTLVGCGGGDEADDVPRTLNGQEVRVVERSHRAAQVVAADANADFSVRSHVRDTRRLCRAGEKAGPFLRALGPACRQAATGDAEYITGVRRLERCETERCAVQALRRVAVGSARVHRSLETYRERTARLDVSADCRGIIAGTEEFATAYGAAAQSANAALEAARAVRRAAADGSAADEDAARDRVDTALDAFGRELERAGRRVDQAVRLDANSCDPRR